MEQELNKAIGYTFAVIVSFHILEIVMPFLTYGLVGMVILRIYLIFQKPK